MFQPKKSYKKMSKQIIKRTANPNVYFTQEHENAIVAYATTSDNKERTSLYIAFIEPVFSEMVNKIVFTYKFTTLPNIDELRSECKIWLTTILEKYNPNSGSKAFSYFSVVTKNWFIHKIKKNAEQTRREVELDDTTKKIVHPSLIVVNPYLESRDQEDFWDKFWIELESWSKIDLTPNEHKIIEAIKIILKEPDAIEIFNKKAVYLYLREITGLNTKQIVNSLNKLRRRYKDFKNDWDSGDIK